MNIDGILVCPTCKGDLLKKAEEYRCDGCQKVFKIEDGIYNFLIDDKDQWSLFRNDFMGDNKEVEDEFLKTQDSELSEADLLFKSLILWQKNDFPGFEKINSIIGKSINANEYNAAMKSSIEYTKNLLKDEKGIILGLASGIGSWLNEFIEEYQREILSVDTDPASSDSLSKYLKYKKSENLVTQIIADTKLLPLKSNSIGVITTAAGLQNIDEGEKVLAELRRTGKKLIGICMFPETDNSGPGPINGKSLHVKEYFKETLEKTGWKIHFENEIKARVEPSPQSKILGGRLYRFPLSPTSSEFAVVVGE